MSIHNWKIYFGPSEGSSSQYLNQRTASDWFNVVSGHEQEGS